MILTAAQPVMAAPFPWHNPCVLILILIPAADLNHQTLCGEKNSFPVEANALTLLRMTGIIMGSIIQSFKNMAGMALISRPGQT